LTAGVDLTGRTVVVTGASAGIGAAAARSLYALGATVVPVGRSPEKTAAVAREVGAEPLVADFERLDDVRRLARDLLERHPVIDVLANNAGGVWPRREVTPDGHERTFQVNHLAPYLLTRLLADRLEAADGRVVTTSSAAHTTGRLDLDDLDTEHRRYRSFRVYGTTKLENVLFTRELARRAAGLTATCLHPGVVASQFARDSPLTRLAYRPPLSRFLRTPEQGAATLVWLASAPDGWTSGGYYADGRPGRLSRAAQDDRLAAALWDRSAELVGLPS